MPRRRGWTDGGAVSVEYALLALFIAVAVIASVIAFGGAVLGLFQAGVNAPWNGNS